MTAVWKMNVDDETEDHQAMSPREKERYSNDSRLMKMLVTTGDSCVEDECRRRDGRPSSHEPREKERYSNDSRLMKMLEGGHSW
jgi:hypothetical protein